MGEDHLFDALPLSYGTMLVPVGTGSYFTLTIWLPPHGAWSQEGKKLWEQEALEAGTPPAGNPNPAFLFVDSTVTILQRPCHAATPRTSERRTEVGTLGRTQATVFTMYPKGCSVR